MNRIVRARQGWRAAALEELVFFQRGYDITKAEQSPGDIPVISSSGITSYHSEPRAHGPGVVIGRKGSLGTIHYVDGPYWPHDTTLWSRNLNHNNPRFVYYFLHTIGLERYDVGNSNPTLNRNHIHGLPIAIPDHRIQERIASILSAYDDLIENNKRRIRLLEQSARLLYDNWFVHLRFPDHEHAAISNGIPEGWEMKPLGELTDINRRNYRSGNLPDEVNYIDISSVNRGRITARNSMSSNDAPGRARRIATSGDVIWANVRPNLCAYALVLDPKENDVLSTGFTVLSPHRIPFSYLYLFVTTDQFVSHLINHATGVGYPAVRAADFGRATTLLPSETVLKHFHCLTAPLFRMVSVLEQEIQSLRKTRDLLLPRLMNGEITV